MFLLALKIFLAIVGVLLTISFIYVSPLLGTRSRDAAPVDVTPRLPMAICIPTAWRKGRWR